MHHFMSSSPSIWLSEPARKWILLFINWGASAWCALIDSQVAGGCARFASRLALPACPSGRPLGSPDCVREPLELAPPLGRRESRVERFCLTCGRDFDCECECECESESDLRQKWKKSNMMMLMIVNYQPASQTACESKFSARTQPVGRAAH